MRSFPFHTACAVALFAALLACARLVWPAIQGPNRAQFQAMVDFTPDRVPLTPLARHVEPETVIAEPPRARFHVPPALLDDSAGVLDHFYQALWRTEKGRTDAVTRIVHYGDSPTTADLITGDIRRQLHQRYGNAGHGFVLVAKPWAWYQHTGVQLSASGWQMSPASHFEARDGLFGLGGVTFTGSGSARTNVVFQDACSRFEVWYLQQPGGGSFSLWSGDEKLGRFETSAAGKSAGFARIEAPAPTHELELRVEQGSVRLFGISAENSGPGVVYDSLGLNGASVTVLSRMFNQAHWAEELQHRRPDLVIVNYGTNEADFASFVDRQYEGELREALRRLRSALPDTSVLIMSPMDRAHRDGSDIATMPTIPRIVAIQKRVARDTGCGFFDTFDAMGGEGTMARWYTAQPRLVSADFIHPYPAGGKIIATIFTREIAAGLNRFKLRQIQPPVTAGVHGNLKLH